MKNEKEMRDEIRRIRERVKQLSGFWIGEAAAAIYALEWAMGKREPAPSEDLFRPRGGREKIAAALVKLAEKAPAPPKQKTPAKVDAKPPVKPRSRPSRAKR